METGGALRDENDVKLLLDDDASSSADNGDDCCTGGWDVGTLVTGAPLSDNDAGTCNAGGPLATRNGADIDAPVVDDKDDADAADAVDGADGPFSGLNLKGSLKSSLTIR